MKVLIMKPKKGQNLTDEMAKKIADRLGKTTFLKDGTIYRGDKSRVSSQEDSKPS